MSLYSCQVQCVMDNNNKKYIFYSNTVHPDINCQSDNPNRCTNPTWTNSSWLGGNLPNPNIVNPPEKDTAIVPSGGYMVVRFRADNPGNSRHLLVYTVQVVL